MDQFSLASALLEAHGGYREVAWKVAGELIAEGVSPEHIFFNLMDDSITARVSAAHEEHLTLIRR